MKKIYASLLFSVSALVASAQLTEANHSPVANTGFNTYQCDTVDPGAAGANALWNYSSIVTHSSIATNYTVASNSTAGYPIPGIAIASATSNISYYKSTPADYKYYGGNLSVGGIPATLIYSSPAVKAVYPMSLNTSSSAATSGTINVPSFNITGTFTGTSSAIADGTGTLALPNATYTNVYRVVTYENINFSASISGTVTQRNYDYYDLSKKESLFTVSTSTIVSTLVTTPSSQTVVTRSFPSTVGIKENKNVLTDLLVFPNPASTTLNFTTESTEAKQVVVYDLTGKQVEKQTLSDGKLKLNVSAYSNGVYMYTVIGSGSQVLKSGKFNVSH